MRRQLQPAQRVARSQRDARRLAAALVDRPCIDDQPLRPALLAYAEEPALALPAERHPHHPDVEQLPHETCVQRLLSEPRVDVDPGLPFSLHTSGKLLAAKQDLSLIHI
eukprot:3390771-Lingulodinium_polyedra.AAC.1